MKRRWDVSVRDGTGPRSQAGLCRGKRDRGVKAARAEGRERGCRTVSRRKKRGEGGGLTAERRATAQWGKLIAEIWVQCKRVARLGLTGGL